MTYEIIGTGSTGNAVLINDEILIDCGLPWKKIEPYAKRLKLVLLTHQHKDHFNPKTAGRLHSERPALRWAMCPWMCRLALDAGLSNRVIDLLDENKAFHYDGIPLDVIPVLLFHDVPNCGYRLFTEGAETLFYATDTGTLDHVTAKNYDLYLIEANHRRAELEERIAEKQAKGEFAYEFRAARNHLSEEQAIEWLSKNMGENSRYVFLHQHKDKVEIPTSATLSG